MTGFLHHATDHRLGTFAIQGNIHLENSIFQGHAADHVMAHLPLAQLTPRMLLHHSPHQLFEAASAVVAEEETSSTVVEAVAGYRTIAKSSAVNARHRLHDGDAICLETAENQIDETIGGLSGAKTTPDLNGWIGSATSTDRAESRHYLDSKVVARMTPSLAPTCKALQQHRP